jgi:hypothetical protein
MDSKAARKEAIKDFKSQKPLRGAFAVRCTTTNHVWVGSTPNLNAARNAVWFTLRHGLHREKALQEEWNAHGEAAFQYEILEQLDDDVAPLSVRDLLKEKKAHWAAELSAPALL